MCPTWNVRQFRTAEEAQGVSVVVRMVAHQLVVATRHVVEGAVDRGDAVNRIKDLFCLSDDCLQHIWVVHEYKTNNVTRYGEQALTVSVIMVVIL